MAVGGALGSGLGAPWSRVTPRHFAWQAWHKLTSTLVSRGRRGTNSHPPSFRVAGVAQTHIHLRFAWAGVALMAVGGALGSGLGAPWSRAAPFCLAGVAQTHIYPRFAWQAWHKHTSTFVSRGRRGTHGSGWRAWVWFGRALVARDAAPFCVAGVAQTHIHPRFAWQAWHKLTSTFVSRGRRGTNSHPPSFRVAGVALMAVGGALGSGLGAPWSRVTPRHFAWQAWHKLTSTIVSRGRRGTNSHPPSFRVAGVAQTHIHLRFAWQAWHSWQWVARLGLVWARPGRAWRRAILRGRRGPTNSHPPSFRVAGVVQTHIHLRFAWQAWHSWQWVARLGLVWARPGRAWRRAILRGRRGTNSHPPSFRVAGVAQTHIHLRFAWQVWHKLTSTFASRGKRGTISHPQAFCVAGVALWQWVARLGSGLGRALVARDAAPFCVAGVAQTHIYHRFAWQAWHKLTSTFASRGRHGTNSHQPSTYIPTVLPSRSFTTSFVFPSFPVPAKTIEVHYWKKLTCGLSGPLIIVANWLTFGDDSTNWGLSIVDLL